MKQIVKVSLGLLLCMLLICNELHAAAISDDSADGLDGYAADDRLRDAIMAVLAGDVDKRGFRCRPGYTYQSVLRDCVPSLGALRGRGGRRQR